MEVLKHESIQQPFIFPDIQAEEGEFDRVEEELGMESDVLMFLAREEGQLRVLDDDLWSRLDNTESKDISKGDWETVDAVIQHSNNDIPKPRDRRDWKDLKRKIESGTKLNAPIIMKYGDIHHVVSGNTRLMVAKALGINPEVLIFEYKENRLDEDSE
jgi:hypothetical protein